MNSMDKLLADSMKKLLAVNQYAEHILGLAAAARQIARATCLDAHEQMAEGLNGLAAAALEIVETSHDLLVEGVGGDEVVRRLIAETTMTLSLYDENLTAMRNHNGECQRGVVEKAGYAAIVAARVRWLAKAEGC